jgi:hypothetical protein
MRALPKLHKVLLDQGYAYFKGHYSLPMPSLPLVRHVLPTKDQDLWRFSVNVMYPGFDGSFGINPPELSYLAQNGEITADDESYSLTNSQSEAIFFSNAFANAAEKISNAPLMIAACSHLMGESVGAEVLAELSALSADFTERKPTLGRQFSKAAYFNLAGRFEEAEALVLTVIEKMPWIKETFPQMKVLSDSQHKSIQITKSTIEYLIRHGARMPELWAEHVRELDKVK